LRILKRTTGRGVKQVIRPIGFFTALVGVLALLASCAGPQRPVLYPNEKLNSVGKEASKKDIDECIQLATSSGATEEKGKKVAKETAKEGVKGAAIGAVIGAITGNVGEAAAIGAAAGGTSGLMDESLDHEVDPVHRGYVDQCLRDRGYQPIGWK
jgi:hypothetical protein